MPTLDPVGNGVLTLELVVGVLVPVPDAGK
jgi:hypothetical protein